MAVGLGSCCVAVDFCHTVWCLRLERLEDEESSRSAFPSPEMLALLLFDCCCVRPLSFKMVSFLGRDERGRGCEVVQRLLKESRGLNRLYRSFVDNEC